jgi:hypothetical protein
VSVLRAGLQRAELAAEHARLVEAALREAGTRVGAARSVTHDRERARNLPIIGPMSGGGTIPGTVPHRHSRRLDSWSGR